jgi:putative ABC transport system ATP-binding protein
MIEVDGFDHQVGGRSIARLAQWRVAAGDACLLLGKSGSGKTTLIHALTGLIRPTQGKIVVDGTDMASLSAGALDQFRGKTFGIVFQTLRLISSLSLRQNLALAGSLAGAAIEPGRIDAIAQRLGISHRLDAKPRALSVGEAQRAAIARAVVTKPAILVADEPTSALDDDNAAVVVALLRDVAAEQGSTLVVASHDQRLISQIPSRVTLEAPQ